jgi:hypothetical protein
MSRVLQIFPSDFNGRRGFPAAPRDMNGDMGHWIPGSS